MFLVNIWEMLVSLLMRPQCMRGAAGARSRWRLVPAKLVCASLEPTCMVPVWGVEGEGAGSDSAGVGQSVAPGAGSRDSDWAVIWRAEEGSA